VEICSAILHEPLPPLSSAVPATMRATVERALAKNPAERFQSAAGLHTALEPLQTAASGGASGRRRWLWAAAASAALAAAGGLWWRGSTGPGTQQLTSTGAPASPIAEANDLFELALQFQTVQNDIPRGLETLERALALDPHFAEARRYHAFAQVILFLNGYTNDTSVLYAAEQELRQVEQEAPDLISLPSAQTAVYMAQGRKDLVPVERLDEVADRGPQDGSLWRMLLHMFAGETDEAKAIALRVIGKTALSGAGHMFLGELLRTEGDTAGAVERQLRVLQQAPNNISSIRFLALAHIDTGQLDKARSLLEEKRSAFERNFLWRLTWAQLLAAEGRREEALAAMDEETQKFAAAAFVVTLGGAEFYSMLGDSTNAIEWLQRAVARGDDRAAWFRRDPQLANIRDDARFQGIVASIEARRR
jgi:tetratricopeptide (TPR) repeat protein